MSLSTWFVDGLLGSPIPPPHWLDPRYRGTGWVAPRASWATLGLFDPGYRVSTERVRADLDEVNTCVNPPVIQGWAWCLALVGVAAAFLGLYGMRTDGPRDAASILLVLCPIPVWFAAVLLGGFLSHDVELRGGSVHLRRWTDVWFGRPGKVVGARSTLHAALSCGDHVQLASNTGVVEVSMRMWPSSSRRTLEDRFENWGIELEFPGRHHVHHPAHWNHGHHRFAHPIAEPERHRHSHP